MKYTNIGNKKISTMGFGGIPIMSGRDSEFLVQLKNVNYENSLRAIYEAYNCGINFFDTAIDYGDSEEKIGKALSNIGNRDGVFIASKSKALEYDEMMRAVEKSLNRLQTEYIDLYQLHYVKDLVSYQKIMGESGAYKALVKLKEEKVIHNIGVDSHNIFVLDQALESMCFDTVQLPFNVIEQESINLLQKADAMKIPTIIMKPFAGGSLTKRFDKIHSYVDSDYELKKIALKFIYQQKVSTVIPGMSSCGEVYENVKIFDEINELSKEELVKLEMIKRQIGNTFCRRCQYCEPTCPANIRISQILRFDKYYEDYGLKKWAKEQYHELNNKADKCKKCYVCESKCPYGLKIVEKLEEIKKKMEK